MMNSESGGLAGEFRRQYEVETVGAPVWWIARRHTINGWVRR
jgi:hypothetical protein